jgi:hypothetical protein
MKNEHDKEEETCRRHSGLSALIFAAASQLESSSLQEIENPNDKQVHALRQDPHSTGVVAHGFTSSYFEDDYRNRSPIGNACKQPFPELLMALAMGHANSDIIAFLPDGRFFAIRVKEFAEQILPHYFSGMSTFQQFLDLANDWGFTKIGDGNGIQVLRHPLFQRGNLVDCQKIKFGESPEDVRKSALPRIEYTFSDESSGTTGTASTNNTTANATTATTTIKRRLSPGSIAKRESESSVTSQKIKTDCEAVIDAASSSSSPTMNVPPPAAAATTSRDNGPNNHDDSAAHACPPINRHDELRSVALSISETMRFVNDKDPERKQHLVEHAVESATHTIVTDAIETLLRDESHSKRTFLKHQDELGKSSLPGVIPISKQLFSSSFTTGD